jgi:hypothetical protein
MTTGRPTPYEEPMMSNCSASRTSSIDRGSILPMVLVVVVVLAVVVTGIATYAAGTLRYGQVVEARAGRIAAAQGALDDALEQLALQNPICPTAGTAGLDIPFPEPINGTSVVVNCRLAGTSLPTSDGWALVVTGAGAPASGNIFEFTLGGQPEISGPVYLQFPFRSSFQHETTLVEGDLWHPDTPCAETGSGSGIQYAGSPIAIPNLTFDPSTRGYYCINRTWDELFGTTGPAVSPDVASLPTNPAWSTSGSCRVFEEGRYTSLDLGANNYFRSGVYVFDDVGLVTLQNRTITMGQTDRQGFPIVDNSACDAVRTADSADGATLYTRGDTQFRSRANSGLEISGRQQGGADGPVVGLQVIDSSLGYATPLLTADNGAQKEAAFHGLLWAPYNSLVFDTVPAQKAAMLRGGAVVASFRGGISAAGSGFVIEIETSESDGVLVLEATATDDRGSNTVRAVAQYRPSSGDLAVNSRRVLDGP